MNSVQLHHLYMPAMMEKASFALGGDEYRFAGFQVHYICGMGAIAEKGAGVLFRVREDQHRLTNPEELTLRNVKGRKDDPMSECELVFNDDRFAWMFYCFGDGHPVDPRITSWYLVSLHELREYGKARERAGKPKHHAWPSPQFYAWRLNNMSPSVVKKSSVDVIAGARQELFVA